MSKKLCDDCIHAHRVTGFPDANLFFVCECEYDPRVPLVMGEGVICPRYKKVHMSGGMKIAEYDEKEEE